MRLTSALTALLILSAAPLGAHADRIARYTPSEEMCREARGELAQAQESARSGRKDEARQLIRALLIREGATIAFEPGTDHRAALVQAVSAWSDAIGENPFRVADSETKPAIEVRLVSKISDGDDLQGEVSFSHANGRCRAEIQVRKETGGRDLTDQEIGVVLTHELGHVLGLEDADDDTGVMAEFDPLHLALRPSDAEATAVREWRSDLRDALLKVG